MIESVVFYMDGVLFDTERVCTDAWYQAGKEMDIPDMGIVAAGCVGLNSKDTRQFFMNQYGKEFPYEEFMKRTSQLFHKTIETEGLPIKPGVFELLKFLQDNHYKIALATSTNKASAVEYLEEAGIINYFEIIVTGDMVRHGKPDPEIYLTACRKLGSLPELCIAIEDSPNGLKSAFHAGLKPIMVPDLIEPAKDLKKLLYGKFESLFGVMNYLQSLSTKQYPH